MSEIKHFLDIDRLDGETLRRILEDGKAFKAGKPPGGAAQPLAGKAVAQIGRASCRERVGQYV